MQPIPPRDGIEAAGSAIVLDSEWDEVEGSNETRPAIAAKNTFLPADGASRTWCPSSPSSFALRHPLVEAASMDPLDRSCTRTRREPRIVPVQLLAQAESALFDDGHLVLAD